MIRLATLDDCAKVEILLNQAKAYFKNNHIDQWQMGYPDVTDIIEDVKKHKGYVYDDGDILGYAMIDMNKDDNYDYIEGHWLNDDSYGVIHRICVSDNAKGKGIGSKFIECAQELALNNGIYNLRIDTHKDNKSMQRLINKNGFVECGIIYVEDKTKRNAYHKELKG